MRNFVESLAALQRVQPALAKRLESPLPTWEWVSGRDGALTGRSSDGEWIGDCSIPYAAAVKMLSSVELRGALACLLAPTHGMMIKRALELLGPGQGLIVIVPCQKDLVAAMHCLNLADDIEHHRVLFTAGDQWKQDLEALFREFPGLPTPNLFVRPSTTPTETAHPLIEGAQAVFRDVIALQGQKLEQLARTRVDLSPDRVCVVAPSTFRLWDDAGSVVADLLEDADGLEVRRFDPDRPSTGSNLALAEAVRGCGALLTANVGRSDVPQGVVPAETAWITWATSDTIPSGERRGVRDRLLVADERWTAEAIRLKWPVECVLVAAWPAEPVAEAAGGPVTLIVNTRPIRTDIDDQTFEFSSHMVLWELIASELTANPLLVAGDAGSYLASRMQRLSISSEGFDRGLFLEQLVYPAYHQGLVRLLTRAGIPVRVWGAGWDQISEFAGISGGPIDSRRELRTAIQCSGALLRPWPGGYAHGIEAFTRAVVTPSQNVPNFLQQVKQCGKAKGRAPRRTIDANLIRRLIGV